MAVPHDIGIGQNAGVDRHFIHGAIERWPGLPVYLPVDEISQVAVRLVSNWESIGNPLRAGPG